MKIVAISKKEYGYTYECGINHDKHTDECHRALLLKIEPLHHSNGCLSEKTVKDMVLAINSHDELLEAAKEARNVLTSPVHIGVLKLIEKAISKANGWIIS